MTTFTIDGRCPTKGSVKSFINPKTGKVVSMADNARLKDWTTQARWAARSAKVPMIYKPHGVMVRVLVQFLKPKTAKQSRPTVRPDLDKCLRAVLDAMTGVCYADDSQVVYVSCVKHYGPSDCTVVEVEVA